MNKNILILFLIISNYISLTAEVKIYKTNEIIVVSEDKQVEKSTSMSEFIIDNSERNKSFTLDKLLNDIAGIYSVRNSKNEGYFQLRGLDQRQIGIYFDGIPIVNQFDGMVDLSQFSLTYLTKISVSKGLSSVLYGANNLGGSINLVTDNVFSENTVNCSINYGDYSQNLGLKAKQQLGNFYVTFSADYNNFDNFRTPANIISNDGIINNSFSKSYSGFAKIANQIGKSFIQSISVLYGTGEKGIPTNIETTKPRYWKMPEWNNIISNYAVNYEILSGIILKSNLFASQFKNIIDSYDDGSYSSQKSKSAFHSTQKYTKYGGLAIVELNWKDFEQSKFAISFSQDEQNQQANTNLDWKIFRSQLISISAEQNFSYKDFGGLIGLSYDLLNPIYANGADLRKNEDFLNYQVGMNYSTEFYNLFANYSHKSRFPTLKEFYGEITGANTPNPNLQSEFTDNYELGLRTNIMKDFNIRASLYANNVKNLIDITVLEDKSRQFINIGKVLFAGLEFGANYNLYDYLINFNFNYQKAENQTENATSKIIPLRPEFSTNLTLSRYFDFGLDAQIQLQSYYNSFAYNSDLKKYFELPDYNLLNVYFSYQLFKNIAVNASFMNILDELYYSDWGYPQIGFNFNCGIKLNY